MRVSWQVTLDKPTSIAIDELPVFVEGKFASILCRIDRTKLFEQRQIHLVELDIYSDIAVSASVRWHDRTWK